MLFPSTQGLPPGLSTAYMQFSETLPSGTFVNSGVGIGAWQGLPLNTIDSDTTGLATLNAANSTFTVPPGKYWVYGRFPFLGTLNTKTRLVDSNSTPVTLLLGSSVYTLNGGNFFQVDSIISGRINLLGYTTLQVNVWPTFNFGSGSLGVPSNIPGVNEVFAQIGLCREPDGR